MSNVTNQLLQHLEALRSAGVEFVPRPTFVQSLPPPMALASSPAPVAEPHAPRFALQTLAAEVAKCDRCKELFSTRTQTVFGVGPDQPELCFVGEAPGADEDRQGEPFVGAAGQLLNKIIAAMGFRREEVYICNILKCRPPRNATPTEQQCANCRPFFERQIELLQPKFLCCLGGVAAKNVLSTSTGITRLRGRVHEYRGIPVVCTYHPSYILRQEGPDTQRVKAECWEDMKLLLRTMGREVPSRS